MLFFHYIFAKNVLTSEQKYTAVGGGVQVSWGGIFEWRKIDTLIGKSKQFSVSFTAPWWRNGSVQRTQSFQFLNRSLFRSSPVVTTVRWRLNEYCQKNKGHRRDSWDEFSVLHFVTKTTGPKSVKPGMSSQFSESRDPSYVSSAICPEWPTL